MATSQHRAHGPQVLAARFVTQRLTERSAGAVRQGLIDRAEGTNSLIQAAKVRARGYRTKDKIITIAYLIAGKLSLPTVTNPTPA